MRALLELALGASRRADARGGKEKKKLEWVFFLFLLLFFPRFFSRAASLFRAVTGVLD